MPDTSTPRPIVEAFSSSDLPGDLRTAIEQYTYAEFGHIPIVQKYKWATPTWSIVVRVGGELRSFLNVVEREALIDKRSVQLAGINNVITPPPFRGNGYSSLAMGFVAKWIFETLNVELGLLLCADELVPFYQRLGWQSATGSLVFDQPGGKITWTQNVMVYTRDRSRFIADKIDLCGFPW